jgi:hypothetical protein
VPCSAEVARSASDPKSHDDVLTELILCDARAHFDDPAGDFVPDNRSGKRAPIDLLTSLDPLTAEEEAAVRTADGARQHSKQEPAFRACWPRNFL